MADEFDDAVRKAGAATPHRKLGGMMMVAASYGPRDRWSSVEFIRTTYALQPINYRFAMMMSEGNSRKARDSWRSLELR